MSLDRPTFAFTAIVWPWVPFVTALFGILLLDDSEVRPSSGPIADVVQTLYGSPWIWETGPNPQFAYGVAFVVGGLGAVTASALIDRRVRGAATASE